MPKHSLEGLFMRFCITIVCMMTLMVGCASTNAEKGTPAESTEVISAEPLIKPPTIEGGELTMTELQKKIRLRDREFTGGSRPTFSVTIENRNPEESLVLELAATFLPSNGESETPQWVRATIPPGGSHQFATAGDKPASEAHLLVREVTTKTK